MNIRVLGLEAWAASQWWEPGTAKETRVTGTIRLQGEAAGETNVINKQLELIELTDLERLVADGVREGKTIEYKRDFYLLDSPKPDFKVKQHEEMLKDISSFANTLGGDLIIGIEDSGAVPSAVCGFDVNDKEVDLLKRRILDVVQNNLDPRIGLDIHSVAVDQDKHVFVIRIQKSLAAPHRVVYRGEFGQFWSRTSSGTSRMDTSELRQAFTQSVSTEERITRYRDERVQAVKAGSSLLPLKSTPKLVCHLIPQDAFGARISLSIPQLRGQLINFPLLVFCGGRSDRARMDGLLVTETAQTSTAEFGYTHVRRNGIVEAVACDATHRNSLDPNSPPFFTHDLVKYVISGVDSYLKGYAGLELVPPAYCFLTLIGVRGMHLYWPGFGRTANPIAEEDIFLPPILCSSFPDEDCTRLLTPAFDLIWNAGGLDYCPLLRTG